MFSCDDDYSQNTGVLVNNHTACAPLSQDCFLALAVSYHHNITYCCILSLYPGHHHTVMVRTNVVNSMIYIRICVKCLSGEWESCINVSSFLCSRVSLWWYKLLDNIDCEIIQNYEMIQRCVIIQECVMIHECVMIQEYVMMYEYVVIRVGFYLAARQRRWPKFLEIEPKYW